jgi:hypothetical protein
VKGASRRTHHEPAAGSVTAILIAAPRLRRVSAERFPPNPDARGTTPAGPQAIRERRRRPPTQLARHVPRETVREVVPGRSSTNERSSGSAARTVPIGLSESLVFTREGQGQLPAIAQFIE